jgi:HK97 family phage prohead protease
MTGRDDIIDIPERRSVPITEFEVRATNNTVHVEGYASIFDKGYDIAGGPDSGGWTEYVNRSAFKTTLAAKPDVVLLENHTGGPLARTKSGTLALATDSTGLISKFDLDQRDPQAKSVYIKLDRGDYDEMSFAFRVKANTWSDSDTIRSLDEVSLHKGDVSIVNFGANPFTSVGLRSAVKMLARDEFSDEEMAELRAMSDQVDAAMAALEQARADDKPYGDVTYADPKNGKYPIDTQEHVKAAWSYINMPKNQKDYDAAELIEIKARIRAAAKKFGIEISDDEKNAHEIIEIVRRAIDGPGWQDDALDADNDGGGDSLARAVHDLVADAAGCAPPTGTTDVPDDTDNPLRNLTLVDATRASASDGNLTAAEAARMCRPEDSPEPLTLEQAEQLAS